MNLTIPSFFIVSLCLILVVYSPRYFNWDTMEWSCGLRDFTTDAYRIKV